MCTVGKTALAPTDSPVLNLIRNSCAPSWPAQPPTGLPRPLSQPWRQSSNEPYCTINLTFCITVWLAWGRFILNCIQTDKSWCKFTESLPPPTTVFKTNTDCCCLKVPWILHRCGSHEVQYAISTYIDINIYILNKSATVVCSFF